MGFLKWCKYSPWCISHAAGAGLFSKIISRLKRCMALTPLEHKTCQVLCLVGQRADLQGSRRYLR